MQPFTQYRGRVAVLDQANVDTDQIIPKQFLKSISRTGFGEHLFYDWRYRDDGTDNPDFVLNQPRYKGATILVAGNNFGCGSSREHAVWAVLQYGFRAIIAPEREVGGEHIPAFADIFRNNGFNNGLLTIELSEDDVRSIMQAEENCPGLEMTIDLEAQQISVHGPEGEQRYEFTMPKGVRENLIRGLDPIARTLESESDIINFEEHHDIQMCVNNM